MCRQFCYEIIYKVSCFKSDWDNVFDMECVVSDMNEYIVNMNGFVLLMIGSSCYSVVNDNDYYYYC